MARNYDLSNFATQFLSMLHTLISSKTRVKLLLKFFLNSNTTAYLRSLEGEFGESTNAIRLEINRFEEAGMLSSESVGNKKIYRANTTHPLFDEVHNILRKYIGLDHIVENVVKRLGEVECVYLVGEFSRGIDSDIIDLIFVGNINKVYLLDLIEKVERLINRKIRYVHYTADEFKTFNLAKLDPQPLILWAKDVRKDDEI
jgi:hypothetical protein